MKPWIYKIVLAAGLALCGPTGLLSGCEDGPDCREVCLHICEICHDGCDLDDPVTADEVDGCIHGCKQQDPDEERSKCLMDTDVCEDLWRC